MKIYNLLILMLFLSNYVFANDINDSQKYVFKWGFLKVAELSVNNGPFNYEQENNRVSAIKFTIRTAGPLKLFKDYNVSGGIKLSKINWEYFIDGYDGGFLEKKSIIYNFVDLPNIKHFIDDKGVSPIKPLSSEQIDPLSSYLRLLERIRESRSCNSNSLVYDGKRNLIISSYELNNKMNSNNEDKNKKNAIICVIDIVNASSFNKNGKWPFNDEKRSIKLHFDNDSSVPSKIELSWPFGSIIGEN